MSTVIVFGQWKYETSNVYGSIQNRTRSRLPQTLIVLKEKTSLNQSLSDSQ